MRRNMVTIRELSHVVDLLDRYAGAEIVNHALTDAGLDRSVLRRMSGFVPYAAEGILIETVARATGDRHLGARLGQDFDYASYGAYASYVLNAPDLATALERGRRAFLLVHPGSQIVLRQTDTHVVAGRNSENLTVIGHRHLDEGTLFVISKVLRHYLGDTWRPDWVELPPDPRTDVARLEKMLEAPVRVLPGAPGVAIRLADLPVLNPDASRDAENITFEELAALMDVEPVQTLVDTVREILQVTIATGDMSEKTVARHLAIGSRTLQRALRREGTSFKAVRSEFAEEKARHLVAHTDIAMEDISKVLGYKDARSFRRAFRRWTGASPMLWRERATRK